MSQQEKDTQRGILNVDFGETLKYRINSYSSFNTHYNYLFNKYIESATMKTLEPAMVFIIK